MQKRPFFVHEPEGEGALAGVLLVLWHGAGGDVDDKSILAVARAFAADGALAARARFPYRLEGRKMPDRMPALIHAASETVARIRESAGAASHALILGGRSMGGRVASMLVAEGHPARGLLFLSYPLHPANAPDKLRTAHLPSIPCPMLFMQGDKDDLARLDLLQPVLADLGPRAMLELFPGEGHTFKRVPVEEIAAKAVAWAHAIIR